MFETLLTNFYFDKIIQIIKNKLKYIILISILFALAGGAYGTYYKSSTYVGQISFYVYSNKDYISDSSVNINSLDFTQAKNLVSSYMQILRSNTFLERVQKELGISYSVDYLRSNISAVSIEDTAVFSVNVYNPNPEDAMNIANAIGELAPNEIIRIVKSGGIEVLDKAELPTVPYQSTSVTKLILIGALGGLVLAFVLFLSFGLLDTTIQKRKDIEDIFKIPILGDVPLMIASSKKHEINKILSLDSPFGLREAYNNIRANLRLTGNLKRCPVYAITSADSAEGKTLNAVNIAISYTQIDKKVLLIDADMRKRSMSTMLDIDESDGLSEYLAGIVDTQPIIQYLDNLFVISAGMMPPNPADLLSSSRWNELLEYCKKEFDVIFIDLPPVGIVSDALLLSNSTTAYLLITREKVSKFDREKKVVLQLEALKANICGFIYNGISMKSKDYTYNKYGKDYFG
ncbi:polysaccharide biosynthesis tyrosine autokinase [Anaeromicropila herbilytica]|uniref:Chromosome partitioning protein n=1 Tax=Anaeromicropila herbilytica TaxID=2785025 RepID=A0A7R7IBN8_9FIRM|nr:polysaccharide biosynthesis tyrosine autokinase [Anaeromicropila herbilytica]BCN29014.1 chromosome partitioning protein [Anaeromicropila herbilytica]